MFGPGAVAQLPAQVARLGARRVALVADEALERAGLVHRVRGPLEKSGCEMATLLTGQPEPSLEVVDETLRLSRRFGPDALLALGGGSNMDLAKVTAVLLTHGRSPQDYFGEDLVPGPVLPVVCLPTTAGTGSEVSAAAVLTDTERALKVGVLSNYLRPRLALVDPELTLSCPAKVTADSGIDALTHAIEAYTAIDNADFPVPDGGVTVYQGRHPLGDCLAEKAVVLIARHLRRAVQSPDDLAAREGMALAATLAGLAFSNVGVALVHALEYPVGGATHCSHGAGNGLLLPYVMRYNLPARRAEMARLAELLGEEVAGLPVEEAAERAITAVERLKAEVGIPTRLRELGVRREQLPEFAEKTLSITRILRVNPRSVTRGELVALLETAW